MAFQTPTGTAAPLLWQQETSMAQQFVQTFYTAFDGNRASIINYYKDVSQVSFEGSLLSGGATFLEKLSQLGLPAGAAHRIVTVDAQPSVAGQGAILVFVTGEYVGQQYSEVFQLVHAGSSLYVHNDIFRVTRTNEFNVPEAAKAVGRQFIEYYYATYDNKRETLVNLYRPQSCYTFEDVRIQGAPKIMEQLQTMPGVQHDPSSITADIQQVNGNALLLVFITGRLVLSGESYPLNFTETFLLVQEGQGYFVGNHIFRLKYG